MWGYCELDEKGTTTLKGMVLKRSDMDSLVFILSQSAKEREISCEDLTYLKVSGLFLELGKLNGGSLFFFGK